jgi:predicted RNA binding protein YcfA (HicA-like mRNA interferase family)
VNHLNAVRALEKAGFHVERQGGHVVMTDGMRTLTIPRHNPINAITMGNIIRDAGLTSMSLEDSSDRSSRISMSLRRAATTC